MKKYVLLLATIYLVSCKQGDDSQKETSVSADSIPAKSQTDLNFDGKQFKVLKLPLILDSAFLASCDTSNKLSYGFIRKMNCTFINHDISRSLQYNLLKFCDIDSLKSAGKYKDYLTSLDVGMTKNSIAFTIGGLEFNNGATLLLWGLNYESMDACPYAFSKSIIATYKNENNECISFIVARDLKEADPPMIANAHVSAEMSSDGNIEITCTTIIENSGNQRDESKQTLVLKVEKEKLTVIGSK
ncbi:MAG: hypothetical protein K0S32_2924 [Bacteroidetes bacterium]|jgi:hypothetical protein|nr:hypothetical protein [Bacteroidota bacterium]